MLAGAGFSSRRRIEELIADGRISVNGHPASIGQRVNLSDKVVVDGRPVQLTPLDTEARVLIYHKPAGEIVSRDDPQGRPSVFDHVPKLNTGRWVSVGRLDFNTSGLLILTTSGELANALMHPGSQIEREYAVRIRGELSEPQMAELCTGIDLDDGAAKFESIQARGGEGSNRWYHVTLHEGRYREVRRLFEAVGLTVSRLTRVRFGTLHLPPRLRPGKFQELSPKEIHSLKGLAGSLDLVERPSEPRVGKNKVLPAKRQFENGRRSSPAVERFAASPGKARQNFSRGVVPPKRSPR